MCLPNLTTVVMSRALILVGTLALVNVGRWAHWWLHQSSKDLPRRLKEEVTHLDILLPGWARQVLEENVLGPHRNFNHQGGVCPQAGCAIMSLDLSRRPAKDAGPMHYWAVGEREFLTVLR